MWQMIKAIEKVTDLLGGCLREVFSIGNGTMFLVKLSIYSQFTYWASLLYFGRNLGMSFFACGALDAKLMADFHNWTLQSIFRSGYNSELIKIIIPVLYFGIGPFKRLSNNSHLECFVCEGDNYFFSTPFFTFHRVVILSSINCLMSPSLKPQSSKTTIAVWR